ncbi:MAG TPA: hypothetical protein DCF84_02270 [Bacteroidetes bacterium]|nr:hypothetical protein [Bacteroidota bacterium]|tara:strand:- start:254 stop:937 length:684 start_codon:yes stop_codon:yes gene_type:complete
MRHQSLSFLIAIMLHTTVLAQISFERLSYNVETYSEDFEVVLKNTLYNSGMDTVTTAWLRIVDDFPAARWTGSSICDNINCAVPSIGNREMLPISPGDSSRLDVHFLTNGFSGDGDVELLVWDVSDSAGSVQTLSFTVKNDASFATNVSDILNEEDVDLSVGNGYVQLSAKSDTRLIVNVYDLLGNQVKSASCNGMLSLDVRDLPATMYFVQVLQGSTLVKTQSFVR